MISASLVSFVMLLNTDLKLIIEQMNYLSIYLFNDKIFAHDNNLSERV